MNRKLLDKIEKQYIKSELKSNKDDLLAKMDSVATDIKNKEYYPEATKAWKTY